jgi:hypothetical protein
VVAIQYFSLPESGLVKAWLNCVSSYVEHKRSDLKRQEFKFDSAIDGRSFWKIPHINGSIRGIQIRLTDTSDEIWVILTSKGRQIFPGAYLRDAIHKKAKKYAPGSIKGIFLLLDCNFPGIDEVDMDHFSEQAKKLNPGFEQIWCVNILAGKTIIKRLA